MATQTGTPFRDTLVGGSDGDELFGLAGDDQLEGGAGADALDGGDGFHDELFGGADDDFLHDPDGAAAIRAGAGADTIDVAFAAGWRNQRGEAIGPDISGDRGDDRISIALDDPAMAIRVIGDPDGEIGNDTVSVAGIYGNVEGILAGGDDVYRGGAFRDDVAGGGGRDQIDGGGAGDSIVGGSDDDVLAGSTGADTLKGDRGFLDTLLGGADDDFLADFDGVGIAAAGRGDDTIALTFAADWDDDDFAGTEAIIDGISGDLGDDSILVSGGSGAAILILGDGATPTGADGDDTIEIAAGAFYGEATLIAGGGHDNIDGAAGRDFVLAGDGFDVVIGREGSDTLDGGADGDFLVGGTDADVLIGQAGDNSLWGDQFLGFGREGAAMEGDGADTLYGGPGDDIIVGGGGANLAYGGAGGDAIYAGREGSITMVGGLGDDSYYIGRGDGTATIVEEGGDGADDYLVYYWGAGPAPYQRLDPSSVRLFDNEDGTWSAYFVHDGSGETTFKPETIRYFNIYDVGENLVPGGGDDIAYRYEWNGFEYV